MDNQTEKKWYQKPVTVVFFLIFFFPVGLYLMWKNELWSKTSRVIVSVFFGLLILGNINKGNNTNSNFPNSSDETKTITFEEAKQFMSTRLSNVNQTLMASKTVIFDGKKIYMFMSVAEDGSTCISGVSEFRLEVMSTNCGNTEMKIQEWNNL
jgi:hypothetical protein